MHICKECGEEENGTWGNNLNAKLELNQWCFSCNFWNDVFLQYSTTIMHEVIGPGGTYVSDTYVAYSVKQNEANKRWSGFSGRAFIVQLDPGGEIFDTENLWHRGNVPEHFRDILHPNIIFLHEYISSGDKDGQ